MYFLVLLFLCQITAGQNQTDQTVPIEGISPQEETSLVDKPVPSEVTTLPRTEQIGSSLLEIERQEENEHEIAETRATEAPLPLATQVPERFPAVEQGSGLTSEVPLLIENGPVTQIPVVIINQSQIPPPAPPPPAVIPWPIPLPELPLPTFHPLPFPTIPPFNLGRFLQGAAGAVPTSSFQLPTLPPFDPNNFFRNVPTFPPFPTLGPWPTLPPWESVYNNIPTLPPFPTIPPLPTWNPFQAGQQCIPRLLTFAQQDAIFGEQLNNFTITANVAGAMEAAAEQARSLCSADQISRLNDFLNSHRNTWELMTKYGQSLTQDERQRVKTMILNNDPVGMTLFGMTKGLENIFDPTASQQISQISSQLSLIQLQLFFSPI